MIVEVFVPALDRSYDIQTGEDNTPVRLAAEVLQLLRRKIGEEEKEEEEDRSGRFCLYQDPPGTMLEGGTPLYEQGGHDGSRLILV